MQEKDLLKVSLVVMLLGLGFLFFYSEELELGPIDSLDAVQAEDTVKVKGEITRMTVKDKVIFLNVLIENDEQASIILFSDEEVFLKEGDFVEITGEVEEYQGKKEVIANEIVNILQQK